MTPETLAADRIADDVLDMAGRVRADRPVEVIAPLAREFKKQLAEREGRVHAIWLACGHGTEPIF